MNNNEHQPPDAPRPCGQDRPVQPQPESSPPEGVGHNPETQRLVDMAKQIIDATPEVRTEKVAALKKAIENGTYSVDSRKLANSILAQILSGME